MLNHVVEHAVVPALGHAQQLFLVAIAVNRFTAFTFPLKHATIWRTRTVVIVTASLTAMSAILGAAWPVFFAILRAVNCPVTNSADIEIYCYVSSYWMSAQVRCFA